MTDLLNPNGDPRGPLRTIVAVGDTRQTRHLVTFDCGHKPDLVQHFCYKVGERMNCFQCGPYGKAQ